MERHAQRVRDRPHANRRRIQDPPLNATEVCPLESAVGAEALLGKSGRPPELSNGRADGFPLEIGRLNLAGAPLHPEASWWYVEAHKPTA